MMFCNTFQLTALVALQRGVVGRGDTNEACRHLQNVIHYQQERIEQLDEENVCSENAMWFTHFSTNIKTKRKMPSSAVQHCHFQIMFVISKVPLTKNNLLMAGNAE